MLRAKDMNLSSEPTNAKFIRVVGPLVEDSVIKCKIVHVSTTSVCSDSDGRLW